jgi:hypothetical protein
LLECIKKIFVGTSTDKAYERAKEIVREKFSETDFAAYSSERAEKCLLPLLGSQISDYYAAEIAKKMNEFTERCEEIKRLNKEKEFFQQLKEDATEVRTNVEKLQL